VRERVRRLFETARLSGADLRVFVARVDDWGHVVVSGDPGAGSHLDDTRLFQGGRCKLSAIVRAAEIQESAQMKETGAIVMAGKGVLRGGQVQGATLLDVVPTLLVLTGHDLAADLSGNVVTTALEEDIADRIPGFVATYEHPDAAAPTSN
jgi:hypothetical protein